MTDIFDDALKITGESVGAIAELEVAAILRENIMELIKAQARVEKLEASLDHWKRTAEYIANGRGHFITDEQIGAAVARALSEPVSRYAWATLNDFGIVRCEGCGGSGQIGLTTNADIASFKSRWPGIDIGEYDSRCQICAKWGSNGWTHD